MSFEKILNKVRSDYNSISKEFSDSRQGDWPIFATFLPYLQSNMNVLDLGCGNGRLFAFLKRHGISDYLGVDGSEELIRLAREQHPDARFECGAMQTFETDERFDLLFAIASFHHLPRELQVSCLKHWQSLLKPGGVLILLNWNFYQRRFWKAWLRMIFRGKFGWKGMEIPWKNRLFRYYYAFSLGELRGLLSKAGFSILEEKTDDNFLIIARA